jgi:hypothetical protein
MSEYWVYSVLKYFRGSFKRVSLFSLYSPEDATPWEHPDPSQAGFCLKQPSSVKCFLGNLQFLLFKNHEQF